ncbi:MAG: MgtC/SapB family protein [Eubacteriales bacterium]|nr:MgtC/SapB family protein [Eubacteriales bacterium]
MPAESLQQLTPLALVTRIALAMLCGGAIGLEREYRRRPAGFRTHMLVCLGATLAMLLGQYAVSVAAQYGGTVRTDVARIAAQVINGVGFLGAGTVLVTDMQQVKGVTTAAGLWASACMGLAIGAGYYECVLFGFISILLCIKVFSLAERHLLKHIRNMNLYIEFDQIGHIGEVTRKLRLYGVTVFSIELQGKSESPTSNPAARLYLQLPKGLCRDTLRARLNELDCVKLMEDV